MKKLLIFFIFATVSMAFADDVYFIKPVEGESLKGSLTIQIEPPRHNTEYVRVWLEKDFGQDEMVWRGMLSKENNFAVTIDIYKYEKGRYKIKAEYYVGGQDYDGDVVFWID